MNIIAFLNGIILENYFLDNGYKPDEKPYE
jgi:hypothetical protein